jgi:hypothetical protein
MQAARPFDFAQGRLCHRRDYFGARETTRPSPRLVSLISDPVCAKEGRCEIRRQGCFLELNQRARRSTIRTCPAGLMKLEQLLERPGCGPSGRTAWPARIYKQELFNL